MEKLEHFFTSLSHIIWGNWLVALLIGTGLYLGWLMRFFYIRKLPQILKETIIKPIINKESTSGEGNVTSFQALCTALGSCVGNGNIVGVATAVVAGGPGSVIWMWIAAMIGMATKYSEILLGMEYREKLEDGSFISGPMYYISKGLHLPKIAILYAVLLLLQNAGGTMIQANAITANMQSMFSVPPIMTIIGVIVLISLMIAGGMKRIGSISQRVVPFMAAFYVIGGIIVICMNISSLPTVFVTMFQSAFSFEAGVGGVLGYSIRESMRYGVARGLYSNEAGEGTAAVLHASAKVDHIGKQAIFGVTEVFVDTIVICSISAIVILTTGVLDTGASPAVLVSMAYGTVHPMFEYIVGLTTVVFGFLSMVAQWYLGNTAIEYIIGNKKSVFYKYIFIVLIIFGGWVNLSLVWSIQDSILGILIIPNIIALILLRKKIKERTDEYLTLVNHLK
ncbi:MULTISPECIES: sodium:alanine symporter family protein [Vagococcus]|uniref:alanine/glycine:cation symporter family protein n=1 Tax=Vagococcus TaxID=2737 RepID=UPI002FC83589